MSLSFSVTSASVRPFMQLLQATSRQGSEIFFEPRADVLHLRAINNSRSTHFLVSIPASHLEGYRCSSGVESPECSHKVSHNNVNHVRVENNNEFNLLLITKALAATVLRQTLGSLSAMHIRFDGASATEIDSRDTLQWECVFTSGIVKKYALPLADGQPERAYFPPECFTFEACAIAKVWASLLASFPATTTRVVVQPLDGRIALWAADDAEVNHLLDPHDSSKSAGVGTTVVALQDNFSFMRYIYSAEAQEQLNVQEEENGKVATPELPGKIIEMRPFKQICYLADQLGMRLCVRSGADNLPIFIEAIAPQDSRLANPTGLSNGPAALPPFPLLSQTESAFRVSFSLYIAALDAPSRAVDNGADRFSTGRRSATNATSVPMTMMTTTATATAGAGAMARNDSIAPIATVMDPSPVDMGAHGGLAGPAITLQATGLTMPISAAGGSRVSCSNTQGPLTCNTSLSHFTSGHGIPQGSSVVKPSRPSVTTTETPLGGIVMPATPYSQEHQPSGWSPYHNKRPREDHETVKTDGPSPTERKSDGTGWMASDSVSFVAATAPSENVAASGLVCPPHCSGGAPQASSFASQYQLDFGVFMRELEEEEEVEADEEDEELQQFLENCASMLVLPATQNVSGPSP